MTKRILLIEDEPGLVLTLTDRLTSEGYHVETAGDGTTGLARATSEPFDLIVLDVMLQAKTASMCAAISGSKTWTRPS